MNAPAQDIGDGGKLWNAMREQDHVAGGKKAVCAFFHTKGDGITPTSVNSSVAKTPCQFAVDWSNKCKCIG